MTATCDAETVILSRSKLSHAQSGQVLRLLACIALVWFGTLARAETIVLLGSDSLLPKSWSDRGVPRGYALDAAREALTRAGFKVRVELTPWARAIAEAKLGAGVINGLSKTPEHERNFLYSQPITFDRVVVVVKKGKEFPFESVRDLAGKTVGVLRGVTYGDEWRAALESFRREEDDHAESRLKKLLLDRIDAAIISSGFVGFRLAAERAGLDPSAFTILPKPLFVEANCLGIAKGPDSANKLERINAAIEVMNGDGITRRIMEKYGNTFEPS